MIPSSAGQEVRSVAGSERSAEAPEEEPPLQLPRFRGPDPLEGVALCTRSGYDQLIFGWQEEHFAAVPLGRREGGVLLAVPDGAIAEEDLDGAHSTGFQGEIGPYRIGDARLRNRQGRLLASRCRVLIVELAVTEDGPRLCFFEEAASEAVRPFFELRSTPYWPAPTELLALKAEWLASYARDDEERPEEQVVPATRCTPYQTADEAVAEAGGADAAAVLPRLRGPPAAPRPSTSAPAGAVASPRALGAAPPRLLRGRLTPAARRRPPVPAATTTGAAMPSKSMD